MDQNALVSLLQEAANETISKKELLQRIVVCAKASGYSVADVDDNRPWGGFVRFNSANSQQFIETFFPGVDPVEIRRGNENAELSPKLLLVLPGQRLSWQVHQRRTERWKFLTRGIYYRSNNLSEMGEQILATPGDIVQFDAGECHRLVGSHEEAYTLVAEIWQHTNPQHLSDESDIIRLQDDYQRSAS